MKRQEERQRTASLEDDLARLSRRDERRMKRLERARCGKCKSKVELRGMSGPIDADERYVNALPSLLRFY